MLKFGCHLSIKEGYLGAAKRAYSYKALSYQYFPKNPRSLSVKSYDHEDAEACRNFCLEHAIESIAHTPYPTSLTAERDKKEAVIQSLKNDLEIAEACGSLGVVVHFGSLLHSGGQIDSYKLMIETLNAVLEGWMGSSRLLIENNAGVIGSIGTTLEELTQIRKLCERPEKIGFCLDTCHAFASALWTGDNWADLAEKGEKLGYFQELKAVHLNNCKYPMGEGKDRHANILHSSGHIKEHQFEELIHSPVLQHALFVLETPKDMGVTHQEEIKELKKRFGQS
ncbi:deoxyribonuclease IV [Peribacillus kribbensis]|uniref:deoxyribonuclease IV n=1 Tax=Peribacillus kribbensis TaxID=356658 RepID=UPI0004290DF1|nr:deoxyribonuclease IV [Peribacillus kribbensis]